MYKDEKIFSENESVINIFNNNENEFNYNSENSNINLNKKKQEKQVVYHYKKGVLIGEGSYGKVYKSFNEDDGKTYAIKEIDLIRLSKLKKYNVSFTYINEINLLYKLDHVNIIKYYGFYLKKHNLNIILEYCNGGSLSSVLKSFKKLNEDLIRNYLTQILKGIEYLHIHNIIHRDIKCANILLNSEGKIKVSDFGEAKLLTKHENKFNFEGTPNWMAPEIIKKNEYSFFSDIWSIGCTVIEMITGKPPFYEIGSNISILNFLYKIKDPINLPQDISNELKDFLEKCLEIEPSKRFNVKKLLEHKFIKGDYNLEYNIGININNNKIKNEYGYENFNKIEQINYENELKENNKIDDNKLNNQKEIYENTKSEIYNSILKKDSTNEEKLLKNESIIKNIDKK
jgi:mitogen-activated protein kinase kinase kinase 3